MKNNELLSEYVIEELKDYIKNPKGYVVLSGEPGRGKSHVALYIYHCITPFVLPQFNHDIAWFVRQTDLNKQFTEAHEQYGSVNYLLEKSYETKLLVLDDLGTRTPSEAFMDFLYAIFDYRCEHRKTHGTIITTNLGSTEIKKNFGSAILSRIGSGRNYKVIGPDRRIEDKDSMARFCEKHGIEIPDKR